MTEGLELDDWAPTEEVRDDVVTPVRALALHNLLDAPGSSPIGGDALPILWHWLAFLPTNPQAELSPDGHPQRGGFLPPISLPRRMFVGGEVSLRENADDGAIRIGKPLRRRGTVNSVRLTTGRSGELIFVGVDYQISGAGAGGSMSERQNLVYRPAPAAVDQSEAASERGGNIGPDHSTWTWGIDFAIDPTLLFRFSALTYNAHRIHYDRAWATEVEGYPGLVVHGPLQAIMLAELCRRGSGRLGWFKFRAVSPAFDDGPLLVRGRPGQEPGEVVLEAFDHRGMTTMTAVGVVT